MVSQASRAVDGDALLKSEFLRVISQVLSIEELVIGISWKQEIKKMLLAASAVFFGLTLGLSHASNSALESTPSSFNNHGGDFISLFSCPTFI